MRLTIAAPREVPLNSFKLGKTLFLFLFAALASGAQQPRENSQIKYVVERLDLVGNRRIEADTLRRWISTRPGDIYSVDAVQRDVRKLWGTQLFDDVRLTVEDSPSLPNGKIVVFTLLEKPIIGRIEYKGIESITESDITGALKVQGVGLSVGVWFDRGKLKRGVVVITELLAVHGHQSATVKPVYEKNPSSNTVTLVFNIDEGPKTKR